MTASSYNSSDPTQASFLAALAAGENPAGNPALGFGGVDLSQAPVDSYGFPQWAGATTSYGPTHAAGLYQFQPTTWDGLASQYGLNFQNPADQNAAAWNLAASTYAAKTGGNLEQALQAGNFTDVANTLGATWTSLNTGRLQQAFATNATPPSGTSSAGGASGGPSSIGGYVANALGLSNVTNIFVRGAVFFLALLLIAFGLFYLADQASGGAVSDGVKGAVLAA